jgi:epoxyqueuosine reductase
VPSGIAKWFRRRVSQEVCPYNRKFAKELSEPAFAPRAALAGMDTRSLSLSLLSMSQAEFSASFRGSPMKRAKLRGLRRNASVVLGNVGSADDAPALLAVLSYEEPLVRGHAAWALGRIGSSAAVAPLRARLSSEDDPWVAEQLRSALAALGG